MDTRMRRTGAQVAVAFNAETGEEVELRDGGLGELVGRGERKSVNGHDDDNWIRVTFSLIVFIVLTPYD